MALLSSVVVRRISLAALVAAGCGRAIDEEPPIPEHRIAPCKAWCAMVFDEDCMPVDAQVKTERECFDYCVELPAYWGPQPDGTDMCREEVTENFECVTSLSCEEQTRMFSLVNVVPVSERPCPDSTRARLDCTKEYYANDGQ